MRPTSLRLGALLAAAVLLVHELRYRLAYGDATEAALAAQGHGYLMIVCALVGTVLAMALGQFLVQMALPRRPGALGGQPPWLAVSAAVLVLFTTQELLEGWLASGHPSGLDGVFEQGGWLAAPLSALAGTALSLLLRGAEAALEARRQHRSCGCSSAAVLGGWSLLGARFLIRDDLVARFLVGRAPPLVLSPYRD